MKKSGSNHLAIAQSWTPVGAARDRPSALGSTGLVTTIPELALRVFEYFGFRAELEDRMHSREQLSRRYIAWLVAMDREDARRHDLAMTLAGVARLCFERGQLDEGKATLSLIAALGDGDDNGNVWLE